MPRKVCKIGESESRYSRGSRGSWLCTSVPLQKTMKKMRFWLDSFCIQIAGPDVAHPLSLRVITPFINNALRASILFLSWFWQNALSLAMKEKIIRCSIDSTNNVASSLNASAYSYPSRTSEIHESKLFHALPLRNALRPLKEKKKRNKITGKSLSREEGCSSKCAKPPSKIKNLVTEVAERSTFFSTRSKLRWKKGGKRRKKKEKYQGKIAQLTHRWERATLH